MADGADLQHHHADRVRDDVVQLARDPRALLGDRDPRRRLGSPSPGPAASACAARSRSANPASHASAKTGVKTMSPVASSGR